MIGIRSLESSNNPKTRRVYSLMFIVDIEEKKEKNINKIARNKEELLLKETIVTYFFQKQKINEYVC